MIYFFQVPHQKIIALQSSDTLDQTSLEKLEWLFSEATCLKDQTVVGYFVGPRKEMITPWSTNAVEITQNMGLKGIVRIEEYFRVKERDATHDPMLQVLYEGLDRDDPIIRNRLRMKLELISDDLAGQADPSEEELREYFDQHPDYFRSWILLSYLNQGFF